MVHHPTVTVHRIITLVLVFGLTGCAQEASESFEADIIIYGGTSAGVVAAVAWLLNRHVIRMTIYIARNRDFKDKVGWRLSARPANYPFFVNLASG